MQSKIVEDSSRRERVKGGKDLIYHKIATRWNHFLTLKISTCTTSIVTLLRKYETTAGSFALLVIMETETKTL